MGYWPVAPAGHSAGLGVPSAPSRHCGSAGKLLPWLADAGDARHLRRLRAWGRVLSPGPGLEASVWALSGMASHGAGIFLPDISPAFLNQKAHHAMGFQFLGSKRQKS